MDRRQCATTRTMSNTWLTFHWPTRIPSPLPSVPVKCSASTLLHSVTQTQETVAINYWYDMKFDSLVLLSFSVAIATQLLLLLLLLPVWVKYSTLMATTKLAIAIRYHNAIIY
jgi:hypothetical protein